MRKLILCFLAFISIILIYKFVYLNPRNWYDHYRYLAQSFLAGRVDIPNLPTFYQDSLEYQGKNIYHFPSSSSCFGANNCCWENTTQQQISIIIGAINAILVFLLLKKFTKPISALSSGYFCFGYCCLLVKRCWHYLVLCP